jgi:hypothetical protein
LAFAEDFLVDEEAGTEGKSEDDEEAEGAASMRIFTLKPPVLPLDFFGASSSRLANSKPSSSSSLLCFLLEPDDLDLDLLLWLTCSSSSSSESCCFLDEDLDDDFFAEDDVDSSRLLRERRDDESSSSLYRPPLL